MEPPEEAGQSVRAPSGGVPLSDTLLQEGHDVRKPWRVTKTENNTPPPDSSHRDLHCKDPASGIHAQTGGHDVGKPKRVTRKVNNTPGPGACAPRPPGARTHVAC